LLVGIVILLIVGGVVAAVLLTRHHHHAAPTTTTVVIRTGAQTTVTTAPATTLPRTTPAKATITVTTTTTSAAHTTTAQATTTTATAAAPTTTAPTTSPAAPPPRAKVSVPDVGNALAPAAIDKLNVAGLMVTLAYVPNDLPLGTVVAESPESGSSAPSGSHVTLNLSSGQGEQAHSGVPSVTGKTIPDALAAIRQAGLRMIFVRKTVSDKSQAGNVVEQTPSPGTQIPRNGKVLVYMAAVR
jgi:serine/threonine-protein kinase